VAETGKTAGRKFRNRRSCHYGLSSGLLWRMINRSKALLAVIVGLGGWEVVAGRDVDLEVGGFVAGELLVDDGEGARSRLAM
jgi:hypothetical protein